MLTYAAPLRDIQFVLEEWLGIPGNPGERRFTELDRYQMLHIVEEAARFCSEVLLPLNASGDEEGCSRTESGVQTPRGFKAAYRAFVDAGWPALACEVTWGGQDLPLVLNAVLYEMLNAVNHAWTMYPGLAHGAYECLKAHGSAALKQRYLPKLVSGEWLATMCLTEPAAGSDVGLIRASARPAGDEDCYLVTADKIFISGGAHDLTENIVHLVLARLPGAPAGSKGLSLLLVPQILADSTHNRVRCTSIEKKMGLKGSATCSLTFDDALGWLIGEPHRGLPAMFVMMNSARLQVALQGLGHAEMAFQNAHRYANDRVQMRAPRRTATSAPADPISSHPAIRRSLGAQRAIVEGERMLGYWIAQLLDTAAGGDASAGQHATKLASLLTPVAKSFFTQNGFEVASDALQIFGGYGYIRETGIEQTVRDSRVSMIYEGTNEIQAIDLMQRKVLADGGATMSALARIIVAEADQNALVPSNGAAAARLKAVLGRLLQTTQLLLAAHERDVEIPYLLAAEYLRATALILLGYVWCKALRLAHAKREADSYYTEKAATGEYFFRYLLPEADWLLQRIEASCAETVHT